MPKPTKGCSAREEEEKEEEDTKNTKFQVKFPKYF
jgi:hypothetical protein